jgi:threonine aldolase
VTDLEDQYRAATLGLERTVFWRRTRPADHFAALAAACADLGVDEWDMYGERGAVARLEAEVCELLGTEAAVFLPSGTMAQQSVLRVWCDRTGSQRVALPDLSHLVTHEQDGPRLLHGLRLEMLTTGRRVATPADLEAVPGPLGATLVELPLRDAGCLLPTWEELTELSAAARSRGVPLHLDGARLWESQPFYDRPLAEIAGLFDSVYVSFYKGLGAMAGACVATTADVATELRQWRHRMGGMLYRLTPYALGGLVGLRDELPRMGEYAAWARSLAVELQARGIRVHPQVPQTCTFQVFTDGTPDLANARLVEVIKREDVQVAGPWRATDDPGVVTNELAVYRAALEFDPALVAGWLAETLGD